MHHFSSDFSSHVTSNDSTPDRSGSLTPQPIRQSCTDETPQSKPTEHHRRRFQCAAFRHQNPINDDEVRQSMAFLRPNNRETTNDQEQRHAVQQLASLPAPSPLPRSQSEEVPAVHSPPVSESVELDSSGSLENTVDVDSLDAAHQLLRAEHQGMSQTPPSTEESQQHPIGDYRETRDGSLGLHVETDDEFSLLIAAAACSYLNSLLQREEETRRVALMGHPGTSLTQDSSTSSASSLAEIEALSSQLAAPLDSLSPFIQDSNPPDSLHSQNNGKFTHSSSALSSSPLSSRCDSTFPSTTSAVVNSGNDDSSTTTASVHHHSHGHLAASSSSDEMMVLNFSTAPLPPPRSTAPFWHRSSTTTHRDSASLSTAVAPLGLNCSTQSSTANQRGEESDVAEDRRLGNNLSSDKPGRANSAYHVAHSVPNNNNNAPNNIYVSRQLRGSSLYPSLSQSSRPQSKETPNPPPPPPTTMARTADHRPANSQPRASSIHPSTLLFAKGVGGRHFSPPMILAHPEEFRNPSSFLKVYGDPLCGLEGRTETTTAVAKSQLSTNGKNGNWVCCKCQNVNYPRRFRCNKCNEIRDGNGDAVVSDYALRVYHHHLKTYKKLSDNIDAATTQHSSPSWPLLSPTSLGLDHNAEQQQRVKSNNHHSGAAPRYSSKPPMYDGQQQQQQQHHYHNNNRPSSMISPSFSPSRLLSYYDDKPPSHVEHSALSHSRDQQQPESQWTRPFNSQPDDQLSHHRGVNENRETDESVNYRCTANHEPFRHNSTMFDYGKETGIGDFHEIFDFLDEDVEFKTPVKPARQPDEKQDRATVPHPANLQSPISPLMSVTHFGTPEKHYFGGCRAGQHSGYNCRAESTFYGERLMNNNRDLASNSCVDRSPKHARLKFPIVEQPRHGLQASPTPHSNHRHQYGTTPSY